MKELKLGMLFIYMFIQVVNISSAYYMKNIGIESAVSSYKVINVSTSDDLKKNKNYKRYVYSLDGIDLNEYSTEDKKEIFLKLMMPAIKISSEEVSAKRKFVRRISKRGKANPQEEELLEKLFVDYKIEDRDLKKLSDKMIIPPVSLILSQAALESGWGTSRFFREGNNVFGVWSYDMDEPRIEAVESREDGFTASLKKYKDLKESVDDYILLLSTGSAYKNLRKGIKKGEDSGKLTRYLIRYSELGADYSERVERVIRVNEFDKYDI